MQKFKKILKYIFYTFLLLLVGVYLAFAYFTRPKSDADILATFKDFNNKPVLTTDNFKEFEFRKLTIQKHDTLPTFVFVHGTIGSCIDFAEYMKDSTLSSKANFVSYDRIGYNYENEYEVQESIAFERNMLQSITKDLNKSKTILVGYSYGGPIALADFSEYKKVILLAPAVYSKVEPMPFLVNLYKWKLTRWLVPDIWKEASKEKLSHREDLKKIEKNWNKNPNTILSIHGDDDMIVPYSNSEYLLKIMPKERFSLKTIPDAGHALVWTEFETIKDEFLKALN